MISKSTWMLVLGVTFSSALAGQSHDAGYAWAREKDITDPESCRARARQDVDDSAAFIEGCTDYLRDEDLLNDDDATTDENDGFESD